MESQSERSARIASTIESAVREDQISNIDSVTDRECSSDRFSGVEVSIEGDYVPVRPIIDSVAEMNGAAIEHFGAIDENDPHVCVFVAYLPEQEHPAFV